MLVSCLVFDGITTLDLVGPLTVFARLPGAQVPTVGLRAGAVRSTRSRLGLIADHALEDAPDGRLLQIPGGPEVRRLTADVRLASWIRRAHSGTEWTASVCTGSLLLAAAGLLAGRPATTHWNAMEELRRFGSIPTAQRYVFSGKVVTAAGVSAGIDMALAVAERIAGEAVARAIQLKIEYDPAPPFDGGAPARSAPEILELARRI